MGCRPSKGYTSKSVQTDAREDIQKVHQLISKLKNPTIDANELKDLIGCLPWLFPSILRYLGEENTIAVLNFLEFNPLIETASNRCAKIKSIRQCIVAYEDESLGDNDKVKKKKLVCLAKKKLEEYINIKVEREFDIKSGLNSLHQKNDYAENLKKLREKLEQQKKSTKTRKMLCKVACNLLFVAILGCAVAVAAINAPAAAITAATAGATILGAVQEPLNSLWAKRMNMLEAQEQALTKMERGGALIKANELENIRTKVNSLVVQMEEVAGELKLGVKEMIENGDGIRVDMEKMKKDVKKLEATISEVKRMRNACVSAIREIACELLKCMLDDENPI